MAPAVRRVEVEGEVGRRTRHSAISGPCPDYLTLRPRRQADSRFYHRLRRLPAGRQGSLTKRSIWIELPPREAVQLKSVSMLEEDQMRPAGHEPLARHAI